MSLVSDERHSPIVGDLDALEQEAEEKGGVLQMPVGHFAKVYKLNTLFSQAA
jgi:hypothetical protein